MSEMVGNSVSPASGTGSTQGYSLNSSLAHLSMCPLLMIPWLHTTRQNQWRRESGAEGGLAPPTFHASRNTHLKLGAISN
jgi:hypothetical protein